MNTINLLAITIITTIVIIISRVNGLLRRRQTEPSHSKSSHSVFDCDEGCFEVMVMMVMMIVVVIMMMTTDDTFRLKILMTMMMPRSDTSRWTKSWMRANKQ